MTTFCKICVKRSPLIFEFLAMSKILWKTVQLIIAVISSLSLVATDTLVNQIRANPMVLSETEVTDKIKTLPGWTTDGKEISRTFQFKDFVTAIDFVNKLVEPAEEAGHHPDIAISYNKVTINLTTHDAGGITQKDFDLAREISQLAQ